MELKTVSEMKSYVEKKFTGPYYTATALPVSQRRKDPDFTVFNLTWTDKEGNPRPEFNGPIRCYKNGVTSSV